VLGSPSDAPWQRFRESGQFMILPWPRLGLGSTPSGPPDNRRYFDLFSADFDCLGIGMFSSLDQNLILAPKIYQ